MKVLRRKWDDRHVLIRHHVNAFFSTRGAASFAEAANRRCRIAMAISLHQGNNAVPAQPLRAHQGPVAVGRFIAPIAGKTLSRGGPVMAGLLSQWPAISGPALAAYTSPAKLTKTRSEQRVSGRKRSLHASSEGGPGKSARSAIRHSAARRAHQPDARLQGRGRNTPRPGARLQRQAAVAPKPLQAGKPGARAGAPSSKLGARSRQHQLKARQANCAAALRAHGRRCQGRGRQIAE